MNIEARIKRNKLDVLAGDCYQSVDSNFIKELQQQGKAALVGVKSKEGVYTIIGKNNTYYCTDSGVEGQISHDNLLEILKKNALKLGKSGKFEFLEIEEGVFIWVMSGQVMTALWNTILLLHNN